MSLKVGDKVQLISGGPEMTINDIGDYDNFNVNGVPYEPEIKDDVTCQWFDGQELKSGTFKIATLQKIN
ncbi:DUF2158 domain-containing protein [Leptospira yasudae]|uniref:YodC family protein n=1 Tax=Leptospira yasudae TaxID=2202201 RepID=UPI001C500191|nr:DUF2158 domain-containing protein [Leptospira yasudae]MBW0436017.1 DUF2158 domain-containing protein [Leptospira yasudae]